MSQQRGQASIEVLALVPVMVLLLIVAVQVMAMLAGASAAQDDARVRAMGVHGAAGTTTVVTGAAVVPVIPVLGWHVVAPVMRAGVRLP
jgi:uncharacterized protein (UPF0333 family)